ncbi:MAG TPA: hypothetical protein VMF52_13150 [Steroidobacteraceae bacterium]|nr:hypothetical protein [Steroidobacteraceae bacterium]
MQGSRKAALLCAAAASVAIAAYAGTSFNGAGVFIVDEVKLAYGYMGGAHNSADDKQMISVNLGGYVSTGARSVSILIRNAAGVQRSCVSTNPVIIATADTIQGDSQVSIQYDAAGRCTVVNVTQNSGYEPKVFRP